MLDNIYNELANNNLVLSKIEQKIQPDAVSIVNNKIENHITNKKNVTIYYAVGNGDNIQEIIGRGRLNGRTSRYFGVGYRYLIPIKLPLKFNTEILKHFGIQRSFEYTVSLVFETKIYNFTKLNFNFAIGNGFSYLPRPSPIIEADEDVKPRKILNYLLIECNAYFSYFKNNSFVFQWHHRCHLFNTIAPKKTGSNYFAIGIRYYF